LSGFCRARSFFCVDQQSEVVVLRWGKYAGTYKKPGDINFVYGVAFEALLCMRMLAPLSK
jgi:regulator of protease activity HflC (stomatin/prohibitin superfamily)